MASATGTNVIPLISSGTAGPLGAVHLPRLWAKLSLHHAGALADGYDSCGPAYDQMTLDALGLDRQRTIDYVGREKPTYVQFERWVLDQNGGTIARERIEAHNAAVLGYNHPEDTGRKMRAASGVTNDGVADAVTLNTLEDLDELHAHLQAR